MADEYKVTKVTERARLSDAGTLEKMYHIEAQSKKGTPFTVDLSEEESQPEKAADILKAKALRLDRLLTL